MNKLRFSLNKKLDKRIAEEFLNIRGGGIDFGKGIIKTHPQLKSVKSLKDITQRKKAISVYFDNYYRIHKEEILRKLKLVRNAWRKKEKKYISVTEDFFGGFRFSKGRYIAYASIINCNPRFLKLKTFQFFYKKPLADTIYTITHELLHFIFFDFVEKNLKKETKHLSEDQLWDLSEIFNVVVLKSPRYRHIINQKFVTPYPNHRHYISQFKKAYKNSQNTKEFIRRGIDIIGAKNSERRFFIF
ncbi:MAG: hypothetical protein KatS3mg098_423 [Candidatus Parcubacteria bacterium]|nr:MAG: hypothetical protein KatS3mg098_423 [Candidatus Parcubacteria bacterium]